MWVIKSKTQVVFCWGAKLFQQNLVFVKKQSMASLRRMQIHDLADSSFLTSNVCSHNSGSVLWIISFLLQQGKSFRSDRTFWKCQVWYWTIFLASVLLGTRRHWIHGSWSVHPQLAPGTTDPSKPSQERFWEVTERWNGGGTRSLPSPMSGYPEAPATYLLSRNGVPRMGRSSESTGPRGSAHRHRSWGETRQHVCVSVGDCHRGRWFHPYPHPMRCCLLLSLLSKWAN